MRDPAPDVFIQSELADAFQEIPTRNRVEIMAKLLPQYYGIRVQNELKWGGDDIHGVPIRSCYRQAVRWPEVHRDFARADEKRSSMRFSGPNLKL